MIYRGKGRLIKGVGGLFTVRLSGGDSPLDGKTVSARGRGTLHRKGALLVGDLVEVSYDDTSFSRTDGGVIPSADGTGIAIDAIEPRKNELIRPPMSNLDVLFVTVAAAAPDPIPETVDKLLCIAEHNQIEPVLVVTKSDLAPERAAELADVYSTAGFSVFRLGEGIDPAGERSLREYISAELNGKIAAFSGASGVGKSTLLNRLFPDLQLETGEISRRIERGKNTTRYVELYPLPEEGYLADTPGFTMLDFERFDFFEREDLPMTFREFVPYIGTCKYTKCSHTKEEGCAILAAVREGLIPRSRHESYLALDEVLKKKKKW